MLRKKRIERGMSQQKLADVIHVDRSTLSGWETGRRLPDAAMISLLSEVLRADVAVFLRATEKPAEALNVIVADDEKIILDGEIEVLREVLPGAEIYGFTEPEEAKAFLKRNKVQLAILDIEMGQISGFDLCRELLEIEPILNVFFLTAFPQYSLDAWKTGACGFLEKPLGADDIRGQLSRLRWPIEGLGDV
jgi:transcriptional regulator with XRE-family HTH domain